jgi:hypothetical protein
MRDTTIYLCDNGAAYCGEHLGATAKATGRDISGQPIMAITPDMGVTVTCEQPKCGRRSSVLYDGVSR